MPGPLCSTPWQGCSELWQSAGIEFQFPGLAAGALPLPLLIPFPPLCPPPPPGRAGHPAPGAPLGVDTPRSRCPEFQPPAPRLPG